MVIGIKGPPAAKEAAVLILVVERFVIRSHLAKGGNTSRHGNTSSFIWGAPPRATFPVYGSS